MDFMRAADCQIKQSRAKQCKFKESKGMESKLTVKTDIVSIIILFLFPFFESVIHSKDIVDVLLVAAIVLPYSIWQS
jgi:hypothetical protein